jgi:hypothetical protein
MNEMTALYPNFLSLTQDGGCIVGNGYLLRIKADGAEEWREEIDGIAYALQQVKDGGYAFCGGELSSPLYDKGWFVKTDEEGYYQSLILYHPADGSTIQYRQDNSIAWRHKNIDQVQILFSSNNGIDWSEVVDAYPADSGLYAWKVPFLISNECKIRLETVDEPVLSSENNESFSILFNYAYDYIAINEIMMWFSNFGDGSHNPYTDNAGLYWPGGEEATISAVFEDGLVFAGIIDGSYYAGGNTHHEGFQAGSILEDGSPANSDSLIFKVWKIRRDWGVTPPGPDRMRLEHDYNNWPVHLGAPWIDNNGDGLYNPEIDQPKLYGDETNWCVMNDMDTSKTQFQFGCDPMGLEIQSTIYGYDRQDVLSDVIFKRYKMINKSDNFIEDMAIGHWSDVDLGFATDDFIGCDTLLDLAFSYNDSNVDNLYGSPPPAIGYMLLLGPLVEGNASDSAWYDGNWIPGYKNLDMTSFAGFI